MYRSLLLLRHNQKKKKSREETIISYTLRRERRGERERPLGYYYTLAFCPLRSLARHWRVPAAPLLACSRRRGQPRPSGGISIRSSGKVPVPSPFHMILRERQDDMNPATSQEPGLLSRSELARSESSVTVLVNYGVQPAHFRLTPPPPSAQPLPPWPRAPPSGVLLHGRSLHLNLRLSLIYICLRVVDCTLATNASVAICSSGTYSPLYLPFLHCIFIFLVMLKVVTYAQHISPSLPLPPPSCASCDVHCVTQAGEGSSDRSAILTQ